MSNETTTRALSPIESFRKEASAMEMELSRALPPHIPQERFLRVLMTAVQTSMASSFTNLLECDRRSLWQAAMRAAQDGLLPDGREGAILPYMGKAQWIPMVGGIRKKARNSGEISTWDVHCVYKNDHFVLKLGDTPSIEHTYDLSKPRGTLIGAYSVALLKDGSKSYEVMSLDEIHAIRDRSQAWKAYKNGKIKTTPWETDEAEMARKTVAKRHAKQLPSSADLDDLMRRDDELYNFKSEDASGEAALPKPKGKAALDQFATQIEHAPETAVNVAEAPQEREAVTIDNETGEITEGQQAASADPAAAIAEAKERGRAAKAKGMSIRAVPPEFREPGRDAEANAWKDGWNSAEGGEA